MSGETFCSPPPPPRGGGGRGGRRSGPSPPYHGQVRDPVESASSDDPLQISSDGEATDQGQLRHQMVDGTVVKGGIGLDTTEEGQDGMVRVDSGVTKSTDQIDGDKDSGRSLSKDRRGPFEYVLDEHDPVVVVHEGEAGRGNVLERVGGGNGIQPTKEVTSGRFHPGRAQGLGRESVVPSPDGVQGQDDGRTGQVREVAKGLVQGRPVPAQDEVHRSCGHHVDGQL